MSDKEKKALKLTTDFASFEEIEDMVMREEEEEVKAKIRWDRMANGYKDKDEEEEREEHDNRMEKAREDMKERSITKREEKMIDFTKLRATDMDNNRRTHMASERPEGEEIEMATRGAIYRKTIEEFKKNIVMKKEELNTAI